MKLNINIQHHKTDKELGEYIDISFGDGESTLYFDIIRKLTATQEDWDKALKLQSEPLSFIDYFFKLKR